MRLRNLVLMLAALTVVVIVAACSSSGQSSDEGGKDQAGKDEQAQKPPEKMAGSKKESPRKESPKMTKEAKSKQVAPAKGKSQGQRKVANRLEPPKDKTLKLTIPEMKQIEDDTIPTGKGTNEALFHDHAAVHLRDTGFPWQRTANVYIAGHRIGFPGTDSNLAFYDLEDLKNGDKVYLEDAEGRSTPTRSSPSSSSSLRTSPYSSRSRARTLSVCRPARCLITQNVSSTGPCSRTSRRKPQGGYRAMNPH